jgi:hypothetical protein
MRDDFFTQYLTYASDSEVPTFFHRWSAIAGVGAFLGRQYTFVHGAFHINPNIYCMLIGSAGTRKSSAIKLIKSILHKANYNTFAADTTTKEKFLLDLAGEDTDSAEQDYDSVLFGTNSEEPREMFIAADEFNTFFGNGNMEFIALLGSLWDYSGPYKNRIKNGKSVTIQDPTVSILGGNTHTGFATAFPTEIMGQGFFSRLILIHSDKSERLITFPTPPTPEATEEVVKYLQRIKMLSVGNAALDKNASLLLDKIYKTWKGIDDVRFESYANRRFTHLLKLCLIHSAARCGSGITEADVIYANTVLTHTEHLMPRALGEFGKNDNSDVSHRIMQKLFAATRPLTLQELFTDVSNDLKNLNQCMELVRNLQIAGKVQSLPQGFLPIRKPIVEDDSGLVDNTLLTEEERAMTK